MQGGRRYRPKGDWRKQAGRERDRDTEKEKRAEHRETRWRENTGIKSCGSECKSCPYSCLFV